MKMIDGYSSFSKSRWKTYREYKCKIGEKEEWFAIDVNGNAVDIITCCSYFVCYAEVIKNGKQKNRY